MEVKPPHDRPASLLWTELGCPATTSETFLRGLCAGPVIGLSDHLPTCVHPALCSKGLTCMDPINGFRPRGSWQETGGREWGQGLILLILSLQVKELNLSFHFLICKVRLMLVFTSKGAVRRIKWGNLCKACSMGSSSQKVLTNLGHCPRGRTGKPIQCLYHLQEEDGRAERDSGRWEEKVKREDKWMKAYKVTILSNKEGMY